MKNPAHAMRRVSSGPPFPEINRPGVLDDATGWQKKMAGWKSGQ